MDRYNGNEGLQAFYAQWEDEIARFGRMALQREADLMMYWLEELREYVAATGEETYSVAEALLSGACEETVRRTVRRGEIDDLRRDGQGRIRVAQRDLDVLRGKARQPLRADDDSIRARARRIVGV